MQSITKDGTLLKLVEFLRKCFLAFTLRSPIWNNPMSALSTQDITILYRLLFPVQCSLFLHKLPKWWILNFICSWLNVYPPGLTAKATLVDFGNATGSSMERLAGQILQKNDLGSFANMMVKLCREFMELKGLFCCRPFRNYCVATRAYVGPWQTKPTVGSWSLSGRHWLSVTLVFQCVSPCRD